MQRLQPPNSFSYSAWKELSSYLLVAIIVFNRRRPGEVQRMELADCKAKAVHSDQSHPELLNMSSDDKSLISKYKMHIIRGKLNRSVSVLLNPAMKRAMSLLISLRDKANVPSGNPYVFGLPSLDPVRWKHLDGSTLIRNFSTKCGVEDPSCLRATVLRKQVATNTAEYGLPETAITDLANHMGHEKAVHKGVYRQATLSRNVVTVAKLLKLAQGASKADESDQEDDGVPDGQMQENEKQQQNLPSTSGMTVLHPPTVALNYPDNLSSISTSRILQSDADSSSNFSCHPSAVSSTGGEWKESQYLLQNLHIAFLFLFIMVTYTTRVK